ncbi:LOW QUALITY PROTEIN: hypothetical protein QYF61_023869, partial [Mycteria americana]
MTAWRRPRYQVLHLGKNNPMSQYRPGADQMENRFSKKEFGGLLTTRQQCTLAAKKVNGILGMHWEEYCQQVKGHDPSSLLSTGHIWSAVSSSGLLITKKMRSYWSESSERQQRLLKNWSICQMGRGRETLDCSAWKRALS